VEFLLSNRRVIRLDRADYRWALQFNWHYMTAAAANRPRVYRAYAVRGQKQAAKLFLHRELAARLLGRPLPPGWPVRPADGDYLNFTRANLLPSLAPLLAKDS
jgi:hypothetical protein